MVLAKFFCNSIVLLVIDWIVLMVSCWYLFEVSILLSRIALFVCWYSLTLLVTLFVVSDILDVVFSICCLCWSKNFSVPSFISLFTVLFRFLDLSCYQLLTMFHLLINPNKLEKQKVNKVSEHKCLYNYINIFSR